MKTAIIVPGVTDMNKGDQALVWESYRLALDTGCFNKVYLVTTGDTPEERNKLCSQSEDKGFEFVENLLKHPRRGKHDQGEAVIESKSSYIKLIITALFDFFSRSFLLLICNNIKIVSFFFGNTVSGSIRKFKECDAIFVKGGGFIHAYGEATAPYLMWFFLFYVRLGFALRKKVIFLPNSYGPFEGVTVKRQVKSVFRRMDKVYARENLSAKKLGDLLGKVVPVSLDLGFYLGAKSDNTVTDNILSKYGLTNKDKIVGVTIRPWRFPGMVNPEQLYNNYIESVRILVEKLIAENYKVVFCNQSIGPNAHEDDRNAIKTLLSKCKDSNVVWINEDMPCDELKALYSKFHAFVGTRFHSVIFSLTSLVPSIAIGYGGNKAKGIMSDLEMEKYAIGIGEVSGEKLIELFQNLEMNRGDIISLLTDKLLLVNKKREAIIDDIVKVFNNQ